MLPQTLSNFCSCLAVLLISFRTGIGRGCTVAENAFIAGKGQYCACTFVGKIRMLFAEFFKDRNQVIVSCSDGAVIKDHLAGWLSVFTDNNTVCEAVSAHIRVVAEVILGHDKRDFARRQHDVSGFHDGIAVFICGFVRHIMKLYENVSLFV